MYRGYIDNRPASGGFEQGVRQLNAQEHRAQVGGHDCVPFLHAGFQQRLGDLHRRIIYQGVQLPGEGVRLGEYGFQVLANRDIGLDVQAVFREGLAKSGPVDADDAPAFLGKQLGGGAANSPGCAGNEHRTACIVLCHHVTPQQSQI